jgi:signal transduction histidine kinase/ActR/RegA family two-component response regulator
LGDDRNPIARLRQGDHLCMIYDGFRHREAALVSFLAGGFSAAERCLVFASNPSRRRLENALTRAGLEVFAALDRGLLVFVSPQDLSADVAAAPLGDAGTLIDLVRQAEQEALEDGFSGLRLTWDMRVEADEAPAPGSRRSVAGLVELEARLTRFLSGSRTIVLCQYSRALCAPEQLYQALRTHPRAVVAQRLCTNDFCEPPEVVLGNGVSGEVVDSMLARLRQGWQRERSLEQMDRRLAEDREALARAGETREQLLAMLAHELRNPLATVSSALQVLRLGESKHGADESWRRAIDAAERQVFHQSLLVDDLIETSRLRRQEIELRREPLDLTRLIVEVVDGYGEMMRDAGLEVEIETTGEPLPMRGDRLRLAQAFSHLLHNAVKFSKRGGRVEVRVSRAEEGRAEVVVRDYGIGIPPELLPHVFDVFTQADHGLDRAKGGLGVGLAMVKGLVELHGGEARASSAGEEGKGSELTLLLPVDREAAGSQTASGAATAQGAPRILVVEDNLDAAITLRDFLELSGFQVKIASSGAAGVEAARQFSPEVVLCDLGLPGMDGFEVAARLRRDPATASVRLIAITGYGGEEDRRRSREAGFDLHLTKPVDPTQLRRVLQESTRAA